VGVGIVARDCMGNPLGAKRLALSLSTDSHTAEFMTASYAVIFTKEVSFFYVIFEGDAMKVIKEVNSSAPYYS
jgi:ribonuclease HI